MGLLRTTGRASAALAIVAIALGGCVAFPRTSDVSAFGQATERAVEAISAPHRMESTLLHEATVYGNACRYLAGSSYRLAAPLPQGSLIIREQAQFLAALQGYATALAGATDPDSVARLRAAGAAFGEAAGTLISTATGKVAGPLPELLLTGGVRAGLEIGEYRRRKEIIAIIENVDPYLLEGGGLMIAEYRTLERQLDHSIAQWKRSSTCVLRQVRASNRPDAFALFQKFDAQLRSIEATRETINGSISLMGYVIATHEKLTTSEIEFDELLGQFNAAVAKLQALKTSLENQ